MAPGLLVERKISAVGIDTPSIDYGQSRDFAAHVELMKNNIPAFENVADMSGMPPTGSTIVALPMKIEGGSGGPLADRGALALERVRDKWIHLVLTRASHSPILTVGIRPLASSSSSSADLRNL